jgi:hypothetical protein
MREGGTYSRSSDAWRSQPHFSSKFILRSHTPQERAIFIPFARKNYSAVSITSGRNGYCQLLNSPTIDSLGRATDKPSDELGDAGLLSAALPRLRFAAFIFDLS